MRWLVEVTSLGKAEKDALHVDADSWQKALQLARSLRGEGEPMSGFSIELLEEGCRAVDPVSRLSYEVHRATGTDDGRAVVSSRPSTAPRPAAATASAVSAGPRSSSSPPPPNHAPPQVVVDGPAPLAPSPSRADPAALPSQIVFKREQDATDALPLTYREYVYVVPPGSSEAGAAALVHAQLELVRASLERAPAGKLVNLAVFDATFAGKPTVPPLATLSWKDWRGAALLTFPRQPGRAPIPVAVGTAAVAPAPAPAPQTMRPVAAAVVPAVAPAVNPFAPAANPFAPVATASAAPPAAAPVPNPFAPAAPTWSAPTVQAPAAIPNPFAPVTMASAPPAAAVAPVPNPFAPLSGAPVALAAPPGVSTLPAGAVVPSALPPGVNPFAPVTAIPAAPAPAVIAAPVFAPSVAPATTSVAPAVSFPQATHAPASPSAAPLGGAPPAAAPAPAGGYLAVETFTPAPGFASVQPAGARSVVPSASPASSTPSKAPGRIHGEDLIADLFESMHDLHFSRDAVEGGDFCLTLAMEKIPSLAGIVQLYDIDRREFLVTSARGAGTSKLLLRRFPESDELLAAAMRRRRAVVIGDAAQNEAAQGERYAALGGAWSLIVAPVMQAGRFLGAIELLNPIDGEPFTESDGNAVTYIAEQLAEFVAARGIVTDPERISMRPTQH